MMPLSDWDLVRPTPMQAGATGNRPRDWELVRPTPMQARATGARPATPAAAVRLSDWDFMQAGARASGEALAVVKGWC